MLVKNQKPGVYLVDPGTDSNLNLLPLGVGLIMSYCRAQPDLADAYDFSIRYLRQSATSLADELRLPAVVGLAAYVWNLQASLAYARAIRMRHPDCLIVMGGASIPGRHDRIRQFLQSNMMVDVLVHGEGELAFCEVLRTSLEGGSLAGVEGISWRNPDKPGGVEINRKRVPSRDLDVFPSPFLDGCFDELMKTHAAQITGSVIESNRGCPYSCTFCDWGRADVHRISCFDLDRVKAEIDKVGQWRIPYIYLADANFGILHERDLILAEHISNCHGRTGNPRYLGINFTKNSSERVVEIADRILASGIQAGVTLASQSLHPPTLQAIKRKNLAVGDLVGLRTLFEKKGITTYNDLILGLPEETLSSFLDGIEEVMTYSLHDHWVVHLCNLLENAEMASPECIERYGLVSRTCKVAMSLRTQVHSEPVEEEDIVVETAAMPSADWQHAYDVAYLAAALHNFRAGFFIVNYLKACFGVRRTKFVEYMLNAVRRQSRAFLPQDAVGEWPVFGKAVDHLQMQRDMILKGEPRYAIVDELGKCAAAPHVALLSFFLNDVDRFYAEFQMLTRGYIRSLGQVPNDALLGDLFAFQKARMNIWQEAGTKLLSLSYDLPRYFSDLANGQMQNRALPGTFPPNEPCRVEITLPVLESADRHAHARSRTRGDRYTNLLPCRVLAVA